MQRRSHHLITTSALLMCFGLSAHAETIAHWTFDEGTGQTAENSTNTSTLDLQLGSSSGPDENDPQWGPGYESSGSLSGSYFQNNAGNNTYARNPDGWSEAEMSSLAPESSYTIELILNANEFRPFFDPDGLGSVTTNGLMSYHDFGADSSVNTQYLMRMNVENDIDSRFQFYTETAVGNFDLILNTASNAGDDFLLTGDTWYYAAAIFDDVTDTLKLMVRDLESGATAFEEFNAAPMAGLSAMPDPRFLIGAERTGNGRSFDGLIDQVRISSAALDESELLYNLGSEVVPGDADGDGDVDAFDLGVWQTQFGQAGDGLSADFDTDGDVDAFDLGIWQINFGTGLGAAVPEPGAASLFAISGLIGVIHRRGRRRPE